MLYGSETWAMTQRDENILRKCDRRMLRYRARVIWQDGISSEEVVRRCGLGDILERARQVRLQWFGHVRREGEEGALRKVKKMQVIENRIHNGKTKGNIGSVSTVRHEKEGTKRGAGNASKKFIKDPPIAWKEKTAGENDDN